MARKTFIKVRTGILSPTHVNTMGNSVWLYLYILSRADWETGKVFQWRDQDAADDLGVYIQTIRNYRRKLEGVYIDCSPRGHGLDVMIRKWANPRTKEDDTDLSLECDKDLSHKAPASDKPSDKVSDKVVDTIVSSIPFNSDLRYQRTELIDNSEKLLSRFVEISKVAYVPRNLTDIDEWNVILRRLHNSGVTDEMMARACEGRNITHPAQILTECARMVTG